MLYIGTSGFKFADWKGAFYPERLAEKDWLAYYAEKFNCLEVNATYYRLLHPATFFYMAKKAPDGFLFTVKAYRTMTHEVGPETESDFPTFVESLRPLVEAGKFGCVLAQFPSSFRPGPESLGYISQFKERLADYPLVVEFRHRSWLTEDTFSWLRESEIGFCGVDEPQFPSLLPPVSRATSDIGYLRFHGRNYKGWWSGSSAHSAGSESPLSLWKEPPRAFTPSEAEGKPRGGNKDRRYDYLYTEEELQPWLPKIRQLEAETKQTFVFMNNCFQAKSATNALQLKALLE